MDFKSIAFFLEVVEKKNLSKAASALFMSQSTLSHQLNVLEKELNVTLFSRKRGQRQMELTPQGEEFLDIAERWMALWKETQALHTRTESPTMAVGGVASLNSCLFYPLYHRLYGAREPGMYLKVKSTQSSALYPALETHELDMAFSVQPAVYSNIKTQAIFSEEQVLIRLRGKGEPEEDWGEDLSTKALNPEHEIIFNFHPDYIRWRNTQWNYYMRSEISVGDVNLLGEFIKTPGTWSIVPRSVAGKIQENAAVILHHIIQSPPARICYLLEHRVPRPGKEGCFQMFRRYLGEFLEEEESKGLLTRI